MSRSSTHDAPATTSHHDGGQFAVGFFIGIMGGMAGMFLFGTKQGHQTLELMRSELSKKIASSETAQTVENELLEAAHSTAAIVKSSAKRLSTRFPTFKQHA